MSTIPQELPKKTNESTTHRSNPPPFPPQEKEEQVEDEMKETVFDLSSSSSLLDSEDQTDQEGQEPVEGISPYMPSHPAIGSVSSVLGMVALGPSAEVTLLFEKMVESLITVDADGIIETTITIGGKAFEGSIFEGAQIVIREFSTAPKAFNVELIADPQALALFQEHEGKLMTTFQEKPLPFQINRLETRVKKTERPLVERKERPEEEAEKDHKR